ncbi:MAG TPA: hypothetical protein VFR19_09320 [Hyphomicrobiaceae bacterium]|nr:hypothetical protein [Hyphomicrobiaceae bacterium]
MGATRKKSWTIHRYLEAPDEPSPVLAWLRAASGQAEEIPLPHGLAFHFRQFGELVVADDNGVDVHRSPLVTVFVPQVRRGRLWTVGEVHLWATPLRQLFPDLHRLSRAFARWLQQFESVFAKGRTRYPEWEYHLEGSVRNSDPAIFALPSGLEALNSGRYFVDHRDSDCVLDRLCKTLKLRGIPCEATD